MSFYLKTPPIKDHIFLAEAVVLKNAGTTVCITVTYVRDTHLGRRQTVCLCILCMLIFRQSWHSRSGRTGQSKQVSDKTK